MVTGAIKRAALCLSLAPICLLGQEDYYPPESFYGGGVGFSQMFLFQNLGELGSFEMLGSVGDTAGFGFDLTQFSNPFVLNGGEGFSNITERIRIGGFAGVGSSFLTKRPEIILFLDLDQDGEFDADTEQKSAYAPPPEVGNQSPDLEAKVSMWVSGATIEYMFPLFKGLEVSVGSLFGYGRLSLNVSQTTGSPSWKDQFRSVFQIRPNGETPVTDANSDGQITEADITHVNNSQIPTIAFSGATTSLSGTFVNIQPYLAVKVQLLDRMGVRMTAGFNTGTIDGGKWKTEGRKKISDSPATELKSLAVRAMIYFGL